ncbi:histidine kinase [Actinorhabdospora filicis]|uniref:histidine kinase n=1 Tax=Actinorhabdospora filicis TaxID=1785913 RepID=A0A9W6SMC1_9ACTN|nr:sensor domain-containing protein [Actinorhabdospora filicis]GLZ78466.1 histidine kinase [Actinorhabdospora filicis]
MRQVRALGRCVLRSWLALAAWTSGACVVLAVLLLPLGLGLAILPGTAAWLRSLTDRARRWAAPVAEPEPLNPDRTASRRSQAGAIIGAESFWRDLLWANLEPGIGGLLVAVPQCLVAYGLFGTLVQPLIWRRVDDGNWYAFIPVTSTPAMLTAAALGLAFIAAGLWATAPVLRLHARWTRLLLAAPRSTALTRRVEHLTGTRADAIDAQAAELGRIERDLHDGAQARLIALGMTLDHATRLLDTDLDTARALLLDVRETSSRALADLRDLVHGIHPPVLADRGLTDALRSLALDSFLDVDVTAEPIGRLPAPVESAAYFAVSEALANATKHSGARTVAIAVTHDGHRLHITVTDDGRGGATIDGGTGLSGVVRRLGTFDGTLALHSPPGGPTTVTMEIPCASSSPKTSSS